MAKLVWKKDLMPVIVQDVKNNNVLMLAYMNAKSYNLTKSTGYMHYYSRERKKIWKKGETSGNLQKVISLHLDCDKDAILARVEQTRNACHTGKYSCFSMIPFQTSNIFTELQQVFEDRKKNPTEGSYVCSLYKDKSKMLKKIGEEATEFIIASKNQNRIEIIHEAADLLFHMLVILFFKGIDIEDIFNELRRRRK